MKKINNIVLIQDDEADCLLNKNLVEEMQLANHIHCLDDEQQALPFLIQCCASAEEPDSQPTALVFLDINLPFLDVYDFLKKLENAPGIDPGKVFVVLLTANWDLNDIERAKHYQISGYLNKPLTQEKLQDVVVRMFEKRVA